MQSGRILDVLLMLACEGYPETTIETVGKRLRSLALTCDLDNAEEVNRCIAEKHVAVGFKSNLRDAFSHYARCHSLTWASPRYKRVFGLPKEKGAGAFVSAALLGMFIIGLPFNEDV